jgi:hypothetical protein
VRAAPKDRSRHQGPTYRYFLVVSGGCVYQHALPTNTHVNVYTETRKSYEVSAAWRDFNLLPLTLSGVHRNINMRRANVFLLIGTFNIIF